LTEKEPFRINRKRAFQGNAENNLSGLLGGVSFHDQAPEEET